MIIVYKIINEEGIVEHVGHTHNTEQRFHGHTKQTPGDGKGKFYKRTDVRLEVISEWETREQARMAETYWQVYYHLQVDMLKGNIQTNRLNTLDHLTRLREN